MQFITCPNMLLVLFLLITEFHYVTADTTLYGGAQKHVLSTGLSSSCSAAFNTSLECPRSVQLLTYSQRAVGWNTSSLNALCTPACNSSLSNLQQAITAGCKGEYYLLGDQNMSYPQVIDLFQHKWGLTCLEDADSGDFCSDIEDTWNITTMVASDTATWPTQTNKTFYVFDEHGWEPYTDENGTLANPYDDNIWYPAASVGILTDRMAGLDYWMERHEPTDDSNYGWSKPLDADEYPLEIQCSSCFLQRYIYGMESTWGTVWDIMSSQVWENMQKNCNLSTSINPANKLSLPPMDILPLPRNLSACSNVQNVTTSMTCQQMGIQFHVSSASISTLNGILCGALHGPACMGESCPIGIVNKTQSVRPFVNQYNNFTLSQFLKWNPYVDTSALMENDTVCVGPPGGSYVLPVATPAYPTSYTTTANASLPTQSGTIPNCGLYYAPKAGDYCNTIVLKFSITLNEFFDMNPSLDTNCGNLYTGTDYCVSPVNGTTVPQRSNTTTSASIPPPASTTVPPPGPTLPGTSTDCRQWHIVESGDTCYGIESLYHITSTQLVSWNKNITASCSNLELGEAYCVAGPAVVSSFTTVTTTTTGAK